MGLGPEAVPECAATDVERAQRSNGRGSILDPAHSRSFQAFADDFAARLGRAAADVPAVAAVSRVVGAMAVVLEVADELAQFFSNLRRRSRCQGKGVQVREQRLAALLVENALGLLVTLR